MQARLVLSFLVLFTAAKPAATVFRYNDRTALNTATAGRPEVDFEDVRNACVALAAWLIYGNIDQTICDIILIENFR